MSAEQKSEKRGMTVKEFFKSTSFKCIIVLLVIVLVCGILLTICNTLFEVTDEERAERDRQSLLENIVEIYGSEVDIETVTTSDLQTSFSNGSISSAYETADGNYIVSSTGTGGFSGGTVTCWVVVLMDDGTVNGIGNVTIASNTSQSWISRVPDEQLDYFGENYESGGSFSVSDINNEGLTGGATYSTTAIVNAVNTALEFVRTQLATGSEEVATDAERLAEIIADIYGSEVEFTEVDISGLTSEYSNGNVNSAFLLADGNYIVNATGTGGFSNGTVTCWVVIKMADGEVSGVGAVAIDSNENQSWIGNVPDGALEHFEDSYTDGGLFDVTDWSDNNLTGGATGSTTAIVNSVNTALQFARGQLAGEEVADPFEGFSYTQYINTTSTTYSVDGSTVTYSIVTTGYGYAGAFTITIVVDEGGIITEYEIVTNGSTQGFDQYMPENISNGSLFIDKNADDILAMFDNSSDGTFETGDLDESLETGSTFSNFLCVYSALFATQNYDTAIEAAAGGEA